MMFPLIHGMLSAIGDVEPPLLPDAGDVWQPYGTQAEDNQWVGIAYGNGVFVAVSRNGTNRAMTSPDGYTWTSRSIPSAIWERVRFLNGKFYAVGSTGFAPRIAVSEDGVSWTLTYSPSTPNLKLKDIAYGNGRFVAIENNNADNVVTASDSDMIWGVTNTITSVGGINAITFGNGKFVAVGGSGDVITSTDGLAWSIASTETCSFRDITFGDGLFVAVTSTSNQGIKTSPDAITWTTRSIDATGHYCVTYGNGRFAALAGASPWSGLWSDDGIAWNESSSYPSSMNVQWQGVAYGDGRFVGVFSNFANRICISPPHA